MQSDDHDDDLLDRLRGIAGSIDPVPAAVLEAARAAVETRDLDGELAGLVADSADVASGRGFEPVRRGPEPVDDRLLSFDGGGVRIEVEVIGDGGGLTVIGQLTGVADRLEFEHGNGRRAEVPVDELGRFLLGGLLPGPVRLRCRSASGAQVTTSWINL